MTVHIGRSVHVGSLTGWALMSAGDDTVALHVRLKPRARRAGILGRHGSGIKAAVRAAPERGRANDELIELLAEALDLARGDIAIVAGARSQDKTLRVRLSHDVLERRLRVALGESD